MATGSVATSDLFPLRDSLRNVPEHSPGTQHASGDSGLTAGINNKEGHQLQEYPRIATLEQSEKSQCLFQSDCKHTGDQVRSVLIHSNRHRSKERDDGRLEMDFFGWLD
ncbi:hypothetical protein CABS01_17122, partial [Colletotrichum abscissum]|uniref:uncharacterized protein n=1 Tax=Colletotrichum abscissum TaxID=1671311 RepID=UPI0027D4A49C